MTLQQANENMQAYCAEYTPAPTVSELFAALGCDVKTVQYVGIAGTVGKTCVATLEASILQAAGFAPVGCLVGGAAPLHSRITIGGKPVPAKIYTAAVAAMGKALAKCDASGLAGLGLSTAKTPMQDLDEAETVAAEFGFTPMQAPAQAPVPDGTPQEEPALSAIAAEFLVACCCFTRAACPFAVAELAEPSYAQCFAKMPACAITQIGADAWGHTAVREAKLAVSVLRTGTSVVTGPAQSEATLDTLTAAAKQNACALTVPDLEDFTEKPHRRLQNRMDYGGYEVILPYLGIHATHNAAIAIELALALWRKGSDISDDAILQGLSLAENAGSVLPLKYRPMVVADACQSPLQAATFAQWVKGEDYENLSLIVGFAKGQLVEDVLSALETGTIVDKDNPEKDQLPGMADNAFDKVYAVAPNCADAMTADEIAALGKFHFDITPCASLTDALAAAQADAAEGVAICGNAALVQQAKALVK